MEVLKKEETKDGFLACEKIIFHARERERKNDEEKRERIRGEREK